MTNFSLSLLSTISWKSWKSWGRLMQWFFLNNFTTINDRETPQNILCKGLQIYCLELVIDDHKICETVSECFILFCLEKKFRQTLNAFLCRKIRRYWSIHDHWYTILRSSTFTTGRASNFKKRFFVVVVDNFLHKTDLLFLKKF